ncbi:MAG: glycerophosphodiester phosphodiesterase family protein [Saprospiraceae bacterium]
MKYSFYLIVIALMSCIQKKDTFDLQGHRGCRGLMPENTIPAFFKALDLGVQTLELDCVISADNKVVVSHEPYFNHEISTAPNGKEITKADEKSHNLYLMNYDSIKKYDVGLKGHPRFVTQVKIEAYKPLLSEMVKASDAYALKTGRPLPYYNIEIKRIISYDRLYNPPVEKFVDLVLKEIENLGISDRATVQSFDLESLRLTHKKQPKWTTALLIENMKSPELNIKELGYIPAIYSCSFKLLNAKSMTYFKSQNIKVIPWTVNSEKDIKEIIALGVDGIISDYPDRVNVVLEELKMH